MDSIRNCAVCGISGKGGNHEQRSHCVLREEVFPAPAAISWRGAYQGDTESAQHQFEGGQRFGIGIVNGEVLMQSSDGTLIFWCAGCNEHHGVWLAANPNPTTGAAWNWNGNKVNPTFSPSIHILPTSVQLCCHSFIKGGMIQYLGDCGHSLAGKTVRMMTIDEEREIEIRDSSHPK